jgi:hypothetical protein
MVPVKLSRGRKNRGRKKKAFCFKDAAVKPVS